MKDIFGGTKTKISRDSEPTFPINYYPFEGLLDVFLAATCKDHVVELFHSNHNALKTQLDYYEKLMGVCILAGTPSSTTVGHNQRRF